MSKELHFNIPEEREEIKQMLIKEYQETQIKKFSTEFPYDVYKNLRTEAILRTHGWLEEAKEPIKQQVEELYEKRQQLLDILLKEIKEKIERKKWFSEFEEGKVYKVQTDYYAYKDIIEKYKDDIKALDGGRPYNTIRLKLVEKLFELEYFKGAKPEDRDLFVYELAKLA